MDPVVVSWVDVQSSPAAWMTVDEAAELRPLPMLTVGWILHEADDFIVVGSTRANDDDTDLVGDVNCIPKALVSQVIRVTDFQKLDSIC